MKTFCIFLENGIEQMGSDAYFRLDSRNSLETQKSDCKQRMTQLRFVKPWYNGFKIIQCEAIGRNEKTIFASS